MRKIARAYALGIICGAAALGSSVNQSDAGVMSIAGKEPLSLSSPLESVHYRCCRYRHYWRHAYWRHRHYRYYGYYPWYNPAGAIAGAAVGLATAPFWALGGYYGYGYRYY
ncbi:hypothetical protein [Methylocystis sp. B8]|uniref:hypothetical protein n=1 Tax=Methylocystis sp. B8 TaxID=544938 RepID=UPI0010FD5E5E|nr:hypothetical protein [Methylocystis sp. B8]TLG71875.1 hypothetical protein FEV16_15430 [Methylocystis sp. B8]